MANHVPRLCRKCKNPLTVKGFCSKCKGTKASKIKRGKMILVFLIVIPYALIGLFFARIVAGKTYYNIPPWYDSKGPGQVGWTIVAFMLGLCFWPIMVIVKLVKISPISIFMRIPPEEKIRRHQEAARDLGLEP